MVLGLMLGFPFTNLCARNVQLVVPVMLLRRFFFFLGGGGSGLMLNVGSCPCTP